MDVPCPSCNSTELQKVSLACLEVLYFCDNRAQFRGVLVASGGPGALVGASTTRGARPAPTAQSGGVRNWRIRRNTSAHLLYFETFFVQTPVATAAYRGLLATRRQNREAGRTFRAES
jgi:hypothetical protein